MFCTRLDEPGLCPVCGMDMEKFIDTGAVMPLDELGRKTLLIRAEPIKRRYLAREIRTLGNFEPDETRERVVAAWVDGRIEKLYADFTGIEVQKGWHLFDLYSPALYAAQKELIVAHKSAEDAAARGSSAKEFAARMLEAAREKLRLLGLSSEQVEEIERAKKPSPTLTISSPSAGVVTEKLAHQGMYVKQGQPIFRVTDLSSLWLILEIHERDLSWIALGQDVEVEVNAYPGRVFPGQVGFIDPQLERTTRTVRVRVEVPNGDRKLKPGMFGTATIFAELSRRGDLATPDLGGDYACPMHPLQRADDPDHECKVCGMDYIKRPVVARSKPGPVWAVPREAVLSTGRRKLVYVEWWVRLEEHDVHEGEEVPPATLLEMPEYQGFEVVLGPLATEYRIASDGTRQKLGEYYPLIKGLPTGIPKTPSGGPGVRIVTNGQFLIDSQMELTGKPSLLRPWGDDAPVDPHAGMKMD